MLKRLVVSFAAFGLLPLVTVVASGCKKPADGSRTTGATASTQPAVELRKLPG